VDKYEGLVADEGGANFIIEEVTLICTGSSLEEEIDQKKI
jgi:hypothetical protein